MTGTDAEDARELLNYRHAFELVGEYLASGAPLRKGSFERFIAGWSRACAAAVKRSPASGERFRSRPRAIRLSILVSCCASRIES